MKLISVIIPAYNAGAFIENCIETILKQTYQCFEIIVVNDGSTDNTLELLEKCAKKDSRVKVISQKNGGVSAARNTALKHAVGEFITYVDADDTMPENALENMLSLMADDVDMVVCSHNEIRIGKTPHIEKEHIYTKQDICDNFIEFDSVVWWPWGKLIRRSIIADNGLTYDTSITFGEDHIFNILYAKHLKGKVVVSSKVAYNYHFIRGGLCSRCHDEMDDYKICIYNNILDFFGGKDETPERYRRYFAGSYLRGNVEYYLAWLNKADAIKRVERCFDNFSDIIDDATIKEYFPYQFDYIKTGNFKAFYEDYFRRYPKKTVWRKFRRSVRKALEQLQRIFLKRA